MIFFKGFCPSGGSREGQETRPSPDQNFFIFIQSSGKIFVWRLLCEILDRPQCPYVFLTAIPIHSIEENDDRPRNGRCTSTLREY